MSAGSLVLEKFFATAFMLGVSLRCTRLLEILRILRVSVSLVAFIFYSWCVVIVGLESSLSVQSLTHVKPREVIGCLNLGFSGVSQTWRKTAFPSTHNIDKDKSDHCYCSQK